MIHDNKEAVLSAMTGNAAIALAKFVAAVVSGSASSLRSPGLAVVVGLVSLADCRTPMRAGGTGGVDGADGSAVADGVSPAADAKVAPEASTCDQLASEIEIQFQTYLDRNSAQACQVDSDCTLWHEQSLKCFAACGLLVGPAAASRPVGITADRICDSYFAVGCPEIQILCVATSIVCQRGRCTYSAPATADPPPDASPSALADAALDSEARADAQSACSMPGVGAVCTPDQVPCATCCTDHWSCNNGAWQNQWLGCLPSTFACGDQACAETSEYCDTDLHFGGLPLPTTYSCQTLPAACNGQRCPTCDCLEQAGISFSSCLASATGAIYVTR